MGKESENILRYGPWAEGRPEKRCWKFGPKTVPCVNGTSIESMYFFHVLFLNAGFFQGLRVSFLQDCKKTAQR